MRDRDVIGVVGGLVDRFVGHAQRVLGGREVVEMRRQAA
jgi:hypothetical protein